MLASWYFIVKMLILYDKTSYKSIGRYWKLVFKAVRLPVDER
jgi:hypothetical protein